MTLFPQNIKMEYETPEIIAQKYYTILLELNGIHCTKQEIRILAFASLRDTISSSTSRRDCQAALGISSNSLNNTISRLQRIGLFVKKDNKIKVNPKIQPDFTNGLFLKIYLLGSKQDFARKDLVADGDPGEGS